MTSTEPHQSILDKPFVLDLFAGPGGLDVAGHVLDIPSLGIEWDRSACLTRYAAGLETLHADVSAVRRDAFESLPPEINVLAGGPPCQTYSVAGKGAGRKALEEVKGYIRRLMAGDSDKEIDKALKTLSDPRTAMVLEPLRYAIQATKSPNREHRAYDVIVLEQVPAVEALWDHYAEVLEETGVTVRVRERIGQRVHPRTPGGALLVYFWCDYLHGRAVNLSPRENLEVAWVPLDQLHRYTALEDLYGPVRARLGLNVARSGDAR
jgi:hypothetical protein